MHPLEQQLLQQGLALLLLLRLLDQQQLLLLMGPVQLVRQLQLQQLLQHRRFLSYCWTRHPAQAAV
jgi:hypothetical protein